MWVTLFLKLGVVGLISRVQDTVYPQGVVQRPKDQKIYEGASPKICKGWDTSHRR